MTRPERMTKAQLIQELAAQRDSLERLQAVVDGSRDAVFISDEHARFVLVNPAACELTGHSVEELLGMRIPDLHEETDRDAYAAHHALILGGQEAMTEADILRKDRTKVAVEFNNRQIVIADRRYMHTVARDITARKQAAGALRESVESYRALFDQANDIILVLDLVPDGLPIIRDANQAALRALGYPRDELIGNPISLVVAGDSPEEEARGTANRLRGTKTTFVGRHRRKDGSTFLVEAAVHELSVGGRLLGVSVERDITARKKMEDDLRESRDQLHSLTARLDDVREEERARLARELHDEVGQNLTAMRMDLAMVKAGLPAGEQQLAGRLHSMIELAQDSVDRVNRMSSELRSPILDMLGLQAAVEAEVAEYQERWGTEIALAGGIGTLPALPERDLVVFRVLKETLANVRQHAQANRVDVSLRVAGEGLVLEVLDDGVGITDEQARSSGSFGLIGMRERAGRLGGTVEVERRPEGGTRVRVTVPV